MGWLFLQSGTGVLLHLMLWGKDNWTLLDDIVHPIQSNTALSDIDNQVIKRIGTAVYTHQNKCLHEPEADKLTCKLQPHELECGRLSRTEDTLPHRFPGKGKPSCQLPNTSELKTVPLWQQAEWEAWFCMWQTPWPQRLLPLYKISGKSFKCYCPVWHSNLPWI